jgi:uncharacterized protein (TIGR02646 family)
MRFILKKKSIPPEFAEIVDPTLNTPDASGYNSLANKSNLRNFLIEEQHGLCAYCNQKITHEKSTIEHVICQSHNSDFDLNYYNLFAVCQGNEGKIATSHCDKYRANKMKNAYFSPFMFFKKCITTSWSEINPFFDVKFINKIGLITGEIIPREQNVEGYPTNLDSIQNSIDVLNLNSEILIEARKVKWENVIDNKIENNISWEDLFSFYLNQKHKTDFLEFVLIAIRKQVV